MRKLLAVIALSLFSLSVHAMTFVEFMDQVPPGGPGQKSICMLEKGGATYFCQDFTLQGEYYRAVLNAPSLTAQIVTLYDFDEDTKLPIGQITAEQVIERHQLANSI